MANATAGVSGSPADRSYGRHAGPTAQQAGHEAAAGRDHQSGQPSGHPSGQPFGHPIGHQPEHQPGHRGPDTASKSVSATGNAPRLRLLLARERSAEFDRFGDLLEPMGIQSIATGCGEEAADLIRREPVHVAVVDWAMPLRSGDRRSGPAGERLLQLLRRLEPAPPTIVVRPRQAMRREHVRGLHAALREGAFAVVDQPIDLEMLLEVLRRILVRHYRGHWPV
ncbi:MAG: hypothetical protein AB8G96_16895 [Phycisphaerales bacterium]